MSFTTHIDHSQHLIVIYNTGRLLQEDLDYALTLFRDPAFPAEYDVLTLFDPDVSIVLDHTGLVDYAIGRQRTLQERTPHLTIRSAFVDVPAALKPMLDLWPLFFPASDNSLSIRFFKTTEDALDWLEREPIELDQLPQFQVLA